MLTYIIKRVLWAILVLLIVVLITYMIFFLLPSGDPAVRLAGKNPTPLLLAQVRLQFGLNHPWYVQYALFLKHAFLGDQYGWPGLGLSFNNKVPLEGHHLQPDRRHGAARGRRCDRLARDRAVDRHPRRAAPAHGRRSNRDGVRGPRHLDARVLPRAACALHLLVQTALAARNRLLPTQPLRVRSMVRSLDLALGRSGGPVRRVLREAHALEPDGDDDGGLRPNGARQRAVRAHASC